MNEFQRIKSMTVSELARKLLEIHECPECCIGIMDGCKNCEFKNFEAMRNWLLSEEEKPEIDLKNRILEIIIKTHLPEYLESCGFKEEWENACKQIYLGSTMFQTLFGSCDCSMEVKAGPINPCPKHPYNEKEGCPKCLQKNQP